MEQSIRPRGRPRRDYTAYVGTFSPDHGLKIVAILDGPRAGNGPNVGTVCTRRGVYTAPRLKDVLRGHTKSCGCLRAEIFIKNCQAAVARMSELFIAGIWGEHSTGSGRKAIAARHKLPYGIVDETIRTYQLGVDAFEAAGLGLAIYRQVCLPGQSVWSAAVSAKVPLVTAQYLLKATLSHVRVTKKRAGYLAAAADDVLEKAGKRGKAWNDGYRPNTLTPREFRRAKGVLVGKYALLYQECKMVAFGMVSSEQWHDLQDFIRLADDTLSARTFRKQQFLDRRARLNGNKK